MRSEAGGDGGFASCCLDTPWCGGGPRGGRTSFVGQIYEDRGERFRLVAIAELREPACSVMRRVAKR